MSQWLKSAAIATWQIAMDMAPYVVLGLIAAMLVYAAFPKDRIRKWLGHKGLWSSVKAAFAGFPLPLCSCGVLPVALALKRSGASNGATFSFLVSEPETGPDSIAVTYALINPLMTVVRPVAALITAITTGLAVEQFSKPINLPESKTVNDASNGIKLSWSERLTASFCYVMTDFLPDIANWLVIGIVLSGILAVLIPANWFEQVGSFWQMVMGVIVGIPLYICASASTPIAAVFLAKGMSPGAALVFLLVGPATNASSFLVIIREFGIRTSIIYLITMIVSAVAMGLLVNFTMGSWDWTPKIADAAHGEQFGAFQWIGLALLIIALFYVWQRQLGNWLRRRARLRPAPIVRA